MWLSAEIDQYRTENRPYEHEPQMDLIVRAQNWDSAAVESLCESYDQFIRLYANRYIWRWIEEEDLVSECYAWFLESLKRFDVNSWFRLSTYARHWMK